MTSFGVRRHSHHGPAFSDLIARADQMMYRAKQRGQSTHHFYRDADS